MQSRMVAGDCHVRLPRSPNAESPQAVAVSLHLEREHLIEPQLRFVGGAPRGPQHKKSFAEQRRVSHDAQSSRRSSSKSDGRYSVGDTRESGPADLEKVGRDFIGFVSCVFDGDWDAAFHAFDLNGTGAVSTSEFVAALQSLRYPWPAGDVLLWMRSSMGVHGGAIDTGAWRMLELLSSRGKGSCSPAVLNAALMARVSAGKVEEEPERYQIESVTLDLLSVPADQLGNDSAGAFPSDTTEEFGVVPNPMISDAPEDSSDGAAESVTPIAQGCVEPETTDVSVRASSWPAPAHVFMDDMAQQARVSPESASVALAPAAAPSPVVRKKKVRPHPQPSPKSMLSGLTARLRQATAGLSAMCNEERSPWWDARSRREAVKSLRGVDASLRVFVDKLEQRHTMCMEIQKAAVTLPLFPALQEIVDQADREKELCAAAGCWIAEFRALKASDVEPSIFVGWSEQAYSELAALLGVCSDVCCTFGTYIETRISERPVERQVARELRKREAAGVPRVVAAAPRLNYRLHIEKYARDLLSKGYAV